MHCRRWRVPVQLVRAVYRVRYGINVTTIIFRNDSYGNVARDLDELFGGTYETDLHNPDFVDFARSFGAVGMRADRPGDLSDLIPRALEHPNPVIIDVPVQSMPLPRPRSLQHVPSLSWAFPKRIKLLCHERTEPGDRFGHPPLTRVFQPGLSQAPSAEGLLEGPAKGLPRPSHRP